MTPITKTHTIDSSTSLPSTGSLLGGSGLRKATNPFNGVSLFDAAKKASNKQAKAPQNGEDKKGTAAKEKAQSAADDAKTKKGDCDSKKGSVTAAQQTEQAQTKTLQGTTKQVTAKLKQDQQKITADNKKDASLKKEIKELASKQGDSGASGAIEASNADTTGAGTKSAFSLRLPGESAGAGSSPKGTPNGHQTLLSNNIGGPSKSNGAQHGGNVTAGAQQHSQTGDTGDAARLKSLIAEEKGVSRQIRTETNSARQTFTRQERTIQQDQNTVKTNETKAQEAMQVAVNADKIAVTTKEIGQATTAVGTALASNPFTAAAAPPVITVGHVATTTGTIADVAAKGLEVGASAAQLASKQDGQTDAGLANTFKSAGNFLSAAGNSNSQNQTAKKPDGGNAQA